jgi:23S rRNA (uracil1939-C5)-methyltransferase
MPEQKTQSAEPVVEAVAEGLSTDGRAVVRVNGTVFFVTGALPGDRVLLWLDPQTKPPSAEVVRLLTPSEHRVIHPCPEAPTCAGSVWGSLNYAEQLKHKRDLVQRTLRKMIGEAIVLPVIGGPHPWHYRNRISLSVWTEDGRTQIGYQTAARQRAGTAISTCHLAHESLLPALKSLADFFADFRTKEITKLPRRIQIHRTKAGAGLLLVFEEEAGERDARKWSERLNEVPLPGRLWAAAGTRAGIADTRKPVFAASGALPMLTTWCGCDVELSPAIFCQANGAAADLVHDKLRDLNSTENFAHIWDLYGGYGALGLAAAEKKPVTILELTEASREPLKRLAALAGNAQTEFIAGDLLRSVNKIATRISADDLLILDPPRSGAHPEVLESIARCKIKNIVYLSCNPARLGRDLALLTTAGFRIAELQPYDFFPQTPRIEVLCLLQRE